MSRVIASGIQYKPLPAVESIPHYRDPAFGPQAGCSQLEQCQNQKHTYSNGNKEQDLRDFLKKLDGKQKLHMDTANYRLLGYK